MGKADAVFTASVVTSSTETAGTGKTQHQVRRYTAEVDRVYQGKVTTARVLITSDQSAACGYGNIPTGRPWVFLVHGRGADFFGNICGGTGHATEAYVRRIERLLGQGTSMSPTAPPRPPLELHRRGCLDPHAAEPAGRAGRGDHPPRAARAGALPAPPGPRLTLTVSARPQRYMPPLGAGAGAGRRSRRSPRWPIITPGGRARRICSSCARAAICWA